MVRARVSRHQQRGLRAAGAADAPVTRRFLWIGAGLFALNAFMCWPLFRIEYLDDFQSNEGSWITFARFLIQNWPHVSWFPWSNAGMPFENTYLPGVGALVAIVSMAGHSTPAHAFHFVAALTYSLAPVSLFLFALCVSGRVWPSAWAALLWSLFSPSLIFPDLLQDTGTLWGIRRLRGIVFWGDTPHNLAMCLLPVSLLLIWRYLERPTARRFALAALAAAAVMLTNAFGIVVVFISSVILFATGKHLGWKPFAAIAGIQLAAYLVVCRFLPPSLIRLLETNSQLVGGDYHFSFRTVGLAGCFLALLAALWAITRRLAHPMLQFALLFSVCFGGITFLGLEGINLLPQPHRYQLEMEPGLCLLAAFLVAPLARRIPMKFAVIACLPLIWVAVKDRQFAKNLIHPADIASAAPFREARWISANLPGQRVLVLGDAEWWFNLFSDNPQMSAGHEPSAPNWIQQVAVYTVYTGQNAGADDGPISVLWLKAFGCGAIVVPGRDSTDFFHGTVANPDKFDGLLPLVWRESGDSIYQVPQRSASLAHVIPRSAAVTTRPKHGLDVGELRRYVDALESADMPQASILWENPDHASIVAQTDPSQVLSVQITYDPGWQARAGDRQVATSADQLGFLLIDPGCSGCTIDLRFTGGWERGVALAVSLGALLTLAGMLFLRTHP
jgi:hypothetical protein